MNSNWQDFLTAAGARIDGDRVSDFGDAATELVAAGNATVIAPLTHLGLIECAGEEAKTFLHNQVTSDINHLGIDAAQHSAWCSAKGRMLASFLLFRKEADFQIQLSADLTALICKRLQMFVLRARVNISDLSNRREIIGMSGVQAENVLRSAGLPVPGRPLDTAAFAAGKIIRLDTTRYEIILDCAAAAEIWQLLAAKARPVGTPVWEWLDIQAGIPLIGAATREEFVPQMVNFEQLGGVSFHKGCYPGQEVVARTQYLGKVKRHLYRLHAAVAMAAGDSIHSPENPEQACGMIVNAAPAPGGGFAALAVIQENHVAAGDLELGKPGGARLAVELVTF